MEDHYVRAHTGAGSTLLLMRLRDAVAELDAVDGRQVHRSWWVARNAVARAEPAGRGWKLTLRNGLVVPVPRERAGELRSAGWLAVSQHGPARPR
jgi:DNA-binding LytR/AlgR family response regulator